jgi:hypothetical protein
MKYWLPLLFAALLAGCGSAGQNSAPKYKRYYLHTLGLMYGLPVSVEQRISNTINNAVTAYAYHIDTVSRSITKKESGEGDVIYYFDKAWLLDSSRYQYGTNPHTVAYYKFPVFETYAHYTIEAGKQINFIEQVMDSAARSVSFVMDGRVSSIDYFDKEGFHQRTDLKDTGGEKEYLYNEKGYCRQEFITLAAMGRIKAWEYEYKYDDHGNWTERTAWRYNVNGLQYKLITTRNISYPPRND